MQFANVIKGEMSIVGPRPQVPRQVERYTGLERRLLDVRPGITDISSVIFSDLETIVQDEPDTDVAYNQLVRPWKSRLGLFYIDHQSFKFDCAIIGLTIVNFINRRQALKSTAALLRRMGAPPEMVAVAERARKLEPVPPPGSDRIFQDPSQSAVG